MSSKFFKRIKRIKKEIVLDENTTKIYSFPTFFHQTECCISIFTCNYTKLSQQMNYWEDLVPIKASKNRGIIIFGFYNHESVAEMDPYKECYIMVPLTRKSLFNNYLLPVIFKSLFKLKYAFLSMSVTSKENYLRGAKIWGLPKKVMPILMKKNGNNILWQVSNNTNIDYEFSTTISGRKAKIEDRSVLLTKSENRTMQSLSLFAGTFLKKRSLFKKSNDTKLTIHNTPNMSKIIDLEISDTPIETRYCEQLESMLFLPESDL